MPKTPALKPKEIIRLIEKAGFVFIRQKGSHKIYKRENILIVVPYHAKDLKRGTQAHILSCAGIELKL